MDQDFQYEKIVWINRQNLYEFTPLMSACFRGYHTKGKAKDCQDERLAIIQCLLDNGAKADYQTGDTKLTPLHWAAYNNDSGCVEELFKRGASPDAFSAMDRLPIDLAGSSRAYEVIDACLTNYYERLGLREDDDGFTGNIAGHSEEQIVFDDKGAENLPFQESESRNKAVRINLQRSKED